MRGTCGGGRQNEIETRHPVKSPLTSLGIIMHTERQFGIANPPNVHIYGLLDKARVPGERQESKLESNPKPPDAEASADH